VADLPVVELVPAVQMPDAPAVDLVPAMPAVATDTAPVVDDPLADCQPDAAVQVVDALPLRMKPIFEARAKAAMLEGNAAGGKSSPNSDETSADIFTGESSFTTQPEPAKPAIRTEPVDPLAEVPASLMKDFGEVRRFKKKAPKVTLLERQVFAREAAKARLTAEDVVKLCILRGWSHFEAVFATPVVMASFYAQMELAQAPATPVKRVNQTESAPPASPSVIRAAKAAMAAALARMKAAGPVDPLAGQKAILAKHARGEHVSPYALDAARLALRV
jgi:hypothetical protein